jgi:phage repressor protein C with HTH and peptisase S24 domain
MRTESGTLDATPADAAEAAQAAARAWVAALAKAKKLHISHLAERAKLDQATLTEAMKTGARRRFSQVTLMRLANHFRVDPPAEAVLHELPRGRLPRDAPQLPASLVQPPSEEVPFPRRGDEVPVRATLMVEGGTWFYLNPVATEWMPRSSGIARIRGAFALRMGDDSMTPWRRPDELVFVDPSRAITPGCHALVPMVPLADPNGADRFLVALITGYPKAGALPPMQLYAPPRGFSVTHMRPAGMPQRVLEWSEVLFGPR